MKKILFIFVILFTLNAESLTQQPLIVEFDVFKEAQKICQGGDYTKLQCLVRELKNYSNRIYTKISGTRGRFSVIFYALDSDGRITYPQNITQKVCEFTDTFGKKSISKLSGNGFNYVLDYNFPASSSNSRAYISCHFMQNNQIISQTTQPISVIPNDFDIQLSIKDARNSDYNLNMIDYPTPSLSQVENSNYTSNTPDLIIKAQTNTININNNATARTINGDIDRGFNETLVPISIKFSRDNGLCNSISESANGGFIFKNGMFFQNNVNINFLDVASGELEIILAHKLDMNDRMTGKCLLSPPQSIDITNAGKVLCQKQIVIRKRVDIVPYSFYISLDNSGKQIYYNQHSFIPAIINLPTIKLNISATNDRNQLLKNFTKDCYAKNLSIKLDDNKNNLIFINENIPNSIIPKDTFLENSISKTIRKLSSSGIKDRDLTPLDLFNSNVINLNDAFLKVGFEDSNIKYPIYNIKPKITNDWRIALMRGRISLIKNTNENTSLIANPKIYYEFYCKSPTCKIEDLESVLSPYTRFPKSNTQDWYINTAHPQNLKVMEDNLSLNENLSIYSIGNISNGVQTMALQSKQKGSFDIKVKQGFGYDDFALFLYFAPNYINIRNDLGVSTKVNF
ncbi:hypothetical protein [Helicobacter sp. MIT 14-3879]|uniref:hypothetical protein n=1 Tax=Helicobacter sp. MIT 14-3879 TaxID=2040649 RepID=UPI000E1F1E80|nr:hypothetical protein [Helicobacter sp. MIT 14-3879]RDU62419.1 hypothetical protein CQA44_06805 [Helicobacter sp. MIT 14-3879]